MPRPRPLRINIDDKGTPSWVRPEEEAEYAASSDLFLDMGFTGWSAGWANQPFIHGEAQVSVGKYEDRDRHAIVVTAPTPMEAVKLLNSILRNKLEPFE